MTNEQRERKEQEKRKRKIESLIFNIKTNTYLFTNTSTTQRQELSIIRVLENCSDCLTIQLDKCKIPFLHRRLNNDA